jgi:hypothetical protein
LAKQSTIHLTLNSRPLAIDQISSSRPTSTPSADGQPQFDIFTQEQTIAEVDAKMTTYSEAVGSLEDDRFTGNFFGGAEVVYDLPGNPALTVDISGIFYLKLRD